MLDSALAVIAVSFAYVLVGMNVYLTKKVFNLVDLTCDASVSVGGCVYGACILYGVHPLMAIAFSVAAGGVAGMITSSFIFHAKLKPLFAGLLTTVILYTVAMRMVNLHDQFGIWGRKILIGHMPIVNVMILTLVVVTSICIALYFILSSKYGLCMKACGGGSIIAESLGVSYKQTCGLWLVIGNMISALAGCAIVQITGMFSVGTGVGALLFGLTAVMIGDHVFGGTHNVGTVISCAVGAFVYHVVLSLIVGNDFSLLGGLEYKQLMVSIIFVSMFMVINSLRDKCDKYVL